MPITCQIPLRPMPRTEFGGASYALMNDLFKIHNELGRFFDEKIYKRFLASLRSDVELEVAVDVVHRSFAKRYYLDVLVARGAILELKAADAFTPRHRAQILHYLLLTELPHGLLVIVRPEQIAREFVNSAMTKDDRLRFATCDTEWNPSISGAGYFREMLEEILRDWGTGLELSLYEEALTHFLGGEEVVLRPAEVAFSGTPLGTQLMRFAAKGVAFKLTAFEEGAATARFAEHAQRLVAHLEIEALFWANIGRHEVQFSTLMAGRKIRAEECSPETSLSITAP